MNKDQRKRLDEALKLLDEANELIGQAQGIVEEVAGDERDKFDNMPEGLQASERGQAIEAAADALDEAVSGFDDLGLDDIIANINTAMEG